MDIPNLAFFVGLVLGALAIVSVCFVYLRKQVLGGGGTALSLVGVVLVGLSLWSNVKIVAPGGWELELERLERQVEASAQQAQQTAEAAKSLSLEVVQVAESVQASKRQLVALTTALEAAPKLNPASLRAVRREVEEAPEIDVERLRAVSRDFDRMRLRAVPPPIP